MFLCVPYFDQSLIATKDQRLMIQFICHHGIIQDMEQMKMIGEADVLQELYVLNYSKIVINARIYIVSLDVLHIRLGHPSNKCFTFPIREHLYVNSIKPDMVFHCYICPLAKQRQLPFISMKNMEDAFFLSYTL